MSSLFLQCRIYSAVTYCHLSSFPTVIIQQHQSVWNHILALLYGHQLNKMLHFLSRNSSKMQNASKFHLHQLHSFWIWSTALLILNVVMPWLLVFVISDFLSGSMAVICTQNTLQSRNVNLESKCLLWDTITMQLQKTGKNNEFDCRKFKKHGQLHLETSQELRMLSRSLSVY